jgi:hypothetical protein
MTAECKKCNICGKLLCEANSGDHCWHHDVLSEDERSLYMSLCSSRETTGFDIVQLNYHGNFGLGVNHNFER